MTAYNLWINNVTFKSLSARVLAAGINNYGSRDWVSASMETLMTILSITIAVAITIILFAALINQTMRAERAEAALRKIEAIIAECGEAIVEYVDEPVYELGSGLTD